MILRNVRRIPRKHTEETKQKISESLKGRKLSKESIARRTNTRAQRHVIWHSEETRRKISDTMRGRKVAPEVKAKISAKLKGRNRKIWECRPHTPETREKIRQSMLKYHAIRKRQLENWAREEAEEQVLAEEQESVADKIKEVREADRIRKRRRQLYD